MDMHRGTNALLLYGLGAGGVCPAVFEPTEADCDRGQTDIVGARWQSLGQATNVESYFVLLFEIIGCFLTNQRVSMAVSIRVQSFRASPPTKCFAIPSLFSGNQMEA
jgi:hypothetical protein